MTLGVMGRPLCRVHPWPGLPPAEWGPACSGPAGVHWLSSGSCVRRRVVRSRLSPRHLPHPAPPVLAPSPGPSPWTVSSFSVTRRRHLHRHTHATWDTRHTHETPHTEHSAPPPHTHIAHGRTRTRRRRRTPHKEVHVARATHSPQIHSSADTARRPSLLGIPRVPIFSQMCVWGAVGGRAALKPPALGSHPESGALHGLQALHPRSTPMGAPSTLVPLPSPSGDPGNQNSHPAVAARPPQQWDTQSGPPFPPEI